MTIAANDTRFEQRIRGCLATVQRWEDVDLLSTIRASLLLKLDEQQAEPDDCYLPCRDAVFIQRLARHYRSTMTWINQPACTKCGEAKTQFSQTRGPETEEEQQGLATRVEVYKCPSCDSVTTFPRYNNPATIYKTRQGRCGEYANLFGAYCRAVGCETRYIYDCTDHVWVEVRVRTGWIMVDACEGVVDRPSMYEQGWGKKLTYIVAIATDHVVDVTPRYTRQYLTGVAVKRRAQVCSSDEVAKRIVLSIHGSLLRASSVQQAYEEEERDLDMLRQQTSWSDTNAYHQGRISGSTVWKQSRGEQGTTVWNEDDEAKGGSCALTVEHFWPCISDGENWTVKLDPLPKQRHAGIVVSGTPCAVGEKGGMSVVVLEHGDCIIQSKSFTKFGDLESFVDTVPEGRIVLMQGVLEKSEEESKDDQDGETSVLNFSLDNLPGFQYYRGGIMLAAQVNASPSWAVCKRLKTEKEPLVFRAQHPKKRSYGWRFFENTRPPCVVARVPDDVMPLSKQLEASYAEKRAAVESLKENYSGYVTKPGVAIFLLGNASFPLETSDDTGWTTFLALPLGLVPDNEPELDEPAKVDTEVVDYEVPVDWTFWTLELGDTLLRNEATATVRSNISDVLNRSRLVGLYFSAHWCGPCRSFTPMLSEFYSVLKSDGPTHGLEIVFVSSDRDSRSFDNYYRTMPWLSIPFDAIASIKPNLSRQYSVRGIPTLIILDTISGEVVVDSSVCRREVSQACMRGEDAIVKLVNEWLHRLPAASTEIVDAIQLSSQVYSEPMQSKQADTKKMDTFLLRSSKPVDSGTRIKHLFAQMVKDGHDPNKAAAQAISAVSKGCFVVASDGMFLPCSLADANGPSPRTTLKSTLSKQGLETVVATVRKYLDNARQEPFNPKYKRFKLSNKIADRLVCKSGRVVQALVVDMLDLELAYRDHEFICSIPLDSDLDRLCQWTQSLRLNE